MVAVTVHRVWTRVSWFKIMVIILFCAIINLIYSLIYNIVYTMVLEDNRYIVRLWYTSNINMVVDKKSFESH